NRNPMRQFREIPVPALARDETVGAAFVFQQELEQDPDDNGTRLVYADFLEENGLERLAIALRVQARFGENYIGPEHWKKFFGLKGEEFPPLLPEALTVEVAEGLKDKHLLAFIPAALGGEALTINRFARLANEVCQKKGRAPALAVSPWLRGGQLTNTA